jgi:hypothetical protein
VEELVVLTQQVQELGQLLLQQQDLIQQVFV